MTTTIEKRAHFIRQRIQDDIDHNHHKQVITRFPPEPNGYLHIGHARAICVNFGMADEFKGECYLRFDDTNPLTEEQVYADAIARDIEWLGFKWNGEIKHTSDYYNELCQFAIELIQAGKAYVDEQSLEEIRQGRGTLTESGVDSPYRNRSVEENLQLFEQMREGKFAEGAYVLRAKIDMASPNINMRDPVIYRIRHASHPRTGGKWCIYPMYDFAHPLSDALEDITHSLCSLEFQDHRPLYDWCVENVSVKGKPQQIEFSRLNLSHTITSKRKLKQLVDGAHVSGWDDPRMPTLSGMRNRGYPPQAIRNLCELTGISKSDSVTDMSLLEECVRDELNKIAPRAMAVLNPIKVIIENYPEDKQEMLTVANHPNDETQGTRSMPFTRELYIEQDDFMEEPVNKFFRLAPGKEVRLRHAYVIKCESVIKDEQGNIQEIRCSYDPETLGKKPEGRKVKGVIHWVCARNAKHFECHLFDRLFNTESPGSTDEFIEALNPDSHQVLKNCYVEPEITKQKLASVFQFERMGYFKFAETTPLTFYRVVGLRDNWAKIQAKG